MDNTTWSTLTNRGNYTNDTSGLMLLPREDTQIEIILNVTFAIFFIIVILTGNSLLLLVIWKYKVLQPCNKLIRTLIASFDMLLATSTGHLIVFISLFSKSSTWNCYISSKISITCVVALMNMSAILATERYIYITKPMKYLNLVNKTRVLLSVALIIAPTLLFFIINGLLDVDGVTVIRVTNFLCIQPNTNSIFYFLSIVLPGLLTLYLFIKLCIFQRRQASTSAEAMDASKAIKLITLISGSLFFSYLPAMIVRMAVLQIWSWEEIEAGVNMPAFIAIRCTAYTLTFVSSTFNPIIQFYTEKDLWVGLLKLMGKKVYFSKQLDVLNAVNSTRD